MFMRADKPTEQGVDLLNQAVALVSGHVEISRPVSARISPSFRTLLYMHQKDDIGHWLALQLSIISIASLCSSGVLMYWDSNPFRRIRQHR